MASLADVMRKNNKKNNFYSAGSKLIPDFKRIPTGIFAVDYMSGGGFPVGVTSSVWGGAGAGKSLILNRIMSGAQNICWNCFKYLWECDCGETKPQKVVLLPIETIDSRHAEQMGVNMNELIVAETTVGEEAVDVIMECMKAEDCGLICLDSLAMLTPKDELDGSALTNSVALQARLISSMMRKIKTSLVRERKKGHSLAFIATNQVRAKIGGFGHQTEEVPGGNVAKHDWHLTLRMSQLKSKYTDGETDLPMYSKFKASSAAMMNKRKIFTMRGTAEYYIATSLNAEHPIGTIWDYTTTFNYAETTGLINKDPWQLVLLPETFKTKTEMLDSWLDTKYFLKVKRIMVEHLIIRAKEEIDACQ